MREGSDGHARADAQGAHGPTGSPVHTQAQRSAVQHATHQETPRIKHTLPVPGSASVSPVQQ